MTAAQAEKILANFRDGEQLKAIPAKRTRKLAVFAWLAERFSVGVVYSEREVNASLSTDAGECQARHRAGLGPASRRR